MAEGALHKATAAVGEALGGGDAAAAIAAAFGAGILASARVAGIARATNDAGITGGCYC